MENPLARTLRINPLRSVINRKQREMHLYNQSSHYGKYTDGTIVKVRAPVNNNNNNIIIIIAEPRPASIECNIQSQVYLHIHAVTHLHVVHLLINH